MMTRNIIGNLSDYNLIKLLQLQATVNVLDIHPCTKIWSNIIKNINAYYDIAIIVHEYTLK